MIKKALLVLAAFALVAAACGDDDTPAIATTPPPPAPTTAAPATTPAAAAGPTVQVTASGLGDILTDADGNTLYLFIPDAAGPSVCNDACAAAWPPLIGEPAAGTGADAALFGTATRADGTTQATYNDWPLYHFGGDSAPGDTNGQTLNDFWWVIDPAGEAIM